MLTVLDEFTRENHAIRVERSITSQQVIDTLEWLFMLRGAPKHIRSDKLRDECLNMEPFTTGHQAQQVVEHWRKEYNEQRPHSSLNYMTSADFAEHYRNSSRPTASLRCGNGEAPRENKQPTENPLTPVGP